MIDSLSLEFHAFTWRMLISLSVDKILLSRYTNRSTNIGGFLFKTYLFCFIYIYLQANASLYLGTSGGVTVSKLD